MNRVSRHMSVKAFHWAMAVLAVVGGTATTFVRGGVDDNPAVAGLAQEVHDQGWVAFSARTEAGDWDLFVVRPDGTDCRNVTHTAAFNEAGVRFSPDGRRMLSYRMPASTPIDNNQYGLHELVVADANGANPVSWGDGFPWASWGPHGRTFACLSIKGIQIVDLSTRQILRNMSRMGIVQQLTWLPDGRWFAGTANGLGVAWTVGRLDAESGRINAVSETDRYNCTPDWLGDSRRVTAIHCQAAFARCCRRRPSEAHAPVLR